MLEIKRFESLHKIRLVTEERLKDQGENKFVNHKLGLEIRVGMQSVITKQDCQ